MPPDQGTIPHLVLFFQYGIMTLLLYGIAFHILAKHAQNEYDMMTTIHIFGYEVFFLMEFVPLLINVNVILLEFLITFLNQNEYLEDSIQNNELDEAHDG